MRTLSESAAQRLVPGVVAYYQVTKDEGAISVLALLVEDGLVYCLRQDPDLTPSWLWEWLRDAASEGLQNPLLRIESRLAHRFEARDAELRALRGYTREPRPKSARLSFADPWLIASLQHLGERLTKEERETASLVFGLGYSRSEAAVALQVSQRTVYRRLARVVALARKIPRPRKR